MNKPENKNSVKKILEDAQGIDLVYDDKEKQDLKIDSYRSGDLIAISNRDKWFSYYWWNDDDKAPTFTKTVDIHRKPGYDPLEMFIDMQKKSISFDTRLVKGSHGRPFDLKTGEGLSAYISSKKIEKDNKDNLFQNNNILSCMDLFEIINKNFS